MARCGEVRKAGSLIAVLKYSFRAAEFFSRSSRLVAAKLGSSCEAMSKT